jgi:hypothetical protein
MAKQLSPQAWVDQIFKDKAGNDRRQVTMGGVLRRAKKSVSQQNADALLKQEVKARGYFLFENANEYTILCGNNLNLIKL